MAHRLLISTPKVDKVLKHGLLTRKFNRLWTQLQVQPICIEFKYIFSSQEIPPKRFYKLSGRKDHKKSYLLAGGRITDIEKSTEWAEKNKMRILVIGTVGINVASWVGAKKNSSTALNRKGLDNCVNQCTVERAQIGIKVETNHFTSRLLDRIPLYIISKVYLDLRLYSNVMGLKDVRSARFWFAVGIFFAAFNAFNRLAEQREILKAMARKAQLRIEDLVSGLWILKDENLGITEYANPFLWNYIID